MFSAFFIDRPRFAIVIALIVTLAGGIALTRIPLAQFPAVVPPQVQVSVSYPGASAKVVEQTVAEPIEEAAALEKELNVLRQRFPPSITPTTVYDSSNFVHATIVEVEQTLAEEGMDIVEAAALGARMRFRAVMMTSIAFIFGLIPLVIATGAAQISRRSLGAPVFAGMIAASAIGIFMIPLLYALFQGISERFGGVGKV